MTTEKLPCVNCVTLPMCKSHMRNREKYKLLGLRRDGEDRHLIVDIITKCVLLYYFLTVSHESSDIKYRIDRVINFLKSDRETEDE